MEGTTVEESKQILIAVTELQANVKNMSAQMNEITKMSSMVVQTEERAKSAHNRIDDIKLDFSKEFARFEKDTDDKIAAECKAREKIENSLTWVWRTLGGGAISIIVGTILFFITRG